MRILFVHGTGVRRERFEVMFELVRRHLGSRLPEAEVVPCYWGDDYGAALAAEGKSIPTRRGARGAPGDESPDSPLDEEAAQWGLLLIDPLCELRVLAEIGDGDDGYGPPGVRSAGDLVADRLANYPHELPEGDEFALLLRSTLLTEHYPAALKQVAESAEFGEACARTADTTTAREVAAAAARAITACLLSAGGADAACTGDERDRLVDLLVTRLGGSARGPGGRVAAVLGKLALRMSTPAVNHWRRSLTEGSVPALGDILRYQARGGPLREFLERQIRAYDGPTVVIGHSLGGIALVDLLAMAAIRQAPVKGVRLLVTVGSQAPFLHELGALAGLAPGAELPPGFPAWLNIFDRQDILSFRAAPIFPGDPRVRDHEVSSRQPFPICHSAYWKLDAVNDEIAAAVKVAR